MKFSSHGTYIRPKSVVAMAMMPAVLDLAKNWRRHRPSTNRMRKPVSKSFTRAGEPCSADLAGEIQKGPDHQQHAAEQAAPFEAGQAALFGQAVKFRQAGQRQKER